MKKRVLQLIPSFHQGGSESQAVSLTKLLKADGSFDVFAATLNDEGVLRAEIDRAGFAEIPEFPLSSFYDTNFVRQVRSCAKYLKSNKIDLIHTHDFYTNVFGMAAATLARVRAKVASKRETSGVRSRPQEFVEKLAFGQAGAVVANSESVRQYIVAQGTAAGKVRIIHNGVDLSRFSEPFERQSICDTLGLPGGADIRFVVLVANLRHTVKNVPMLLRAAERVCCNDRKTHFVIAGEGELRSELVALAEKLGLTNHVHFTGRCEYVPALVSLADVCVLTSVAEGFSNSILEYMAAGKAVVATNVGGASEAIIEGETGYLVNSDDDDALATHLIDLLQNPAKGIAFGQKGRDVIASKFSNETRLNETLELYGSLLSE